LRKLELIKNYTALDLFRTHQEFILGEVHFKKVLGINILGTARKVFR